MGDRLVPRDARAPSETSRRPDRAFEGRVHVCTIASAAFWAMVWRIAPRAPIIHAVSTVMPEPETTVRLSFSSAFEMLDMVQLVSDQIGRGLRFDEDALTWMEVAVRESVINAIKHGNRHDRKKHVTVEFTTRPAPAPEELVIVVRDQGDGFDPDGIADPLAPENLLKSSGRGIFFMRSFMDDVQLARLPGGGMEVRMVKRLTAES
jgi:serine/threonine-protein kinase RsbW